MTVMTVGRSCTDERTGSDEMSEAAEAEIWPDRPAVGWERPVLLVDMDGVLADFDGALWEGTKDLVEYDIESLEDQRHRFLTDHLGSQFDRRLVRGVVERPGWFRDLPVMVGALEAMEEIRETGVEIWVCTKPLEANPSCRDDKGAWLREHFPYLEGRMIIAPDKSLVVGSVLLDDAPHPTSIGRALWRPVLFDSVWHRHDARYAGFESWSWRDPVEDLLSKLVSV